MKVSADSKICAFLDGMRLVDVEKYEILHTLRTLVLDKAPDASERFIYGGIMFSVGSDFGGIFAHKHHISFEFGQGYLFEDPDKLLEGGGKYRQHLKLRSPDDVLAKKVAFFIDQAIAKSTQKAEHP